MIYLSSFRFPSWDSEYSFRLNEVKRTCYNTIYPFFVLSRRALRELNFTDVTILYGGNGSGKTTALNVIAEKLGLARTALYNRSSFFGDYLKMCSSSKERDIPSHSAVITSDDVFSYMLDIRAVNEGVDIRREELFDEYNRRKRELSAVRSLEDFDRLKDIVDARRLTQSKFVKSRLGDNIKEQSNGESAYFYFTQRVKDGGLYLLDEPENSLAPDLQLKLCDFLFESVFVGEADLPERGMPSNDLARGVADYYLHNSRIPKALIGKILKLGLMRPGQEKYLPLEEVVELGGRSVKVLPCPGHTPGSCLFLDENTASLFAGDAINGAFWAFTSPQTNLKEYAEVWENLKPRLQGVKRLWISHHRAPLDAGYIDAFIKALRTTGEGECKPVGIKGTPEQVNIYKVKDEKFGTLTFWAYPSQVR